MYKDPVTAATLGLGFRWAGRFIRGGDLQRGTGVDRGGDDFRQV